MECNSNNAVYLQDSTFKRFVEVGRGTIDYDLCRAEGAKVLIVVLLKSGPSAGKIAVIAEIIDHNRVRAMIFCTRRLTDLTLSSIL